ncbi:MAG TPA: agmatinase [Anaerohalosphaeraceae bacterium]|nr:agmatinase [Anaerohalosphaeraceae bacterium]HOM75362.1 agmatinase [Anaerohalosphaeraceae bacterium]HPC64242.1 agmatinase [Anaerohalosphaeraceae bacterium]HPO69346.1 agmatinase [Anaerohalosphaeraceae bacterium]HRS72240.1 agmatinase [Anaerohalosphaeraceae bacterium]
MGRARRTQFGDFSPRFYNPETAAIAILPVPYDGTSTWIKGADKGPQAILDASYNLEFYDIETDSEVFRKGIFTEPPVEGFADPVRLAGVVRQRMSRILEQNKFPVVLGGEHSVSIGVIEAMADKYKDLTVLQLDAHSDLRDSYEGSTHNHACVMARAKEFAAVVQVGIRSMDISEKKNMDWGRVFFSHDICSRTDQQWIDQAVEHLTENVYLTIDLDVFDPSIMPATGTPEPGGINWYEAVHLIRAVCSRRNLTGFDVVELCPREHLWASDFLAAKLVYKTLTYKFCL